MANRNPARSPSDDLANPCGRPYTRREVMDLLQLRCDDTLALWIRRGVGPPFVRLGAKHSRVLFPRAAFWEWLESRTVTTADEADALTR